MSFAVGDAVVFDRNSLGPSWAGYVGSRAVVTGAWDLERDWHL